MPVDSGNYVYNRGPSLCERYPICASAERLSTLKRQWYSQMLFFKRFARTKVLHSPVFNSETRDLAKLESLDF